MNDVRAFMIGLIAAASAAAAYACWPHGDDNVSAPAPVHVPTEPLEAPANGSPPAEGKLAELTPAQMPVMPGIEPAKTSFPDGTTLTALNGVTVPLHIDWPGNRPYSAVVEIVTNENGVAFYKHADGSFSTTLQRIESVSGKLVQFAQTYTPGPAPGGTRLRH